MAIPSTTEFQSKGSLGEVEDIEMTIDEDGMQFLMSILTNLYENPTLAVVREYSTNAADAHIEAGYDGPVEVTLPTQFQKNFIVRDYGPGMDLEDIRNTYSKYVASTKRQDNTQAGMFGIGAKSALALGDTFTVESIKKGHKIVVAVLRKGRGKASMKIVQHNVPTSESDGTTIKVPAKNPYAFEQSARQFYPYIKKGVFKVNGEERGETFDGIKVDDTTYALPQHSSYNNTSYIVMGNVPYPVTLNERRAVVKYVPPGTFEPTPPREGLEQTPGFNKRIVKYLEEAAEGVADALSKEIKDLDPSKAAERIKQKNRMLTDWNAMDKVKYDGRRLGDKFNFTGCVRVMGTTSIAPDNECKFKDYLLGAHIVEWDKKKKTDANDYACKKAWGVRSLVGYPNGVFLHFKGNKPKYAAESNVMTWERAKQTNNWGGTSRNYGSSVLKAGDDWKVPTRKAHYVVDSTPSYPKRATKVVPFADWKGSNDPRQLVYFSPTELDTRSKVNLVNVLYDDKDTFLVIKYTNQHDKTKRDTPEAKHFTTVGKEMAKKLVAQHGEGAFIDISYPSLWENVKGDMFDKLRLYKSKVKKNHGATSDERALVRSFGDDFLTIEAEFDKLVAKVKARYPLLSSLSWSASKSDINEYVQAMDAYKKETKNG